MKLERIIINIINPKKMLDCIPAELYWLNYRHVQRTSALLNAIIIIINNNNHDNNNNNNNNSTFGRQQWGEDQT